MRLFIIGVTAALAIVALVPSQQTGPASSHPLPKSTSVTIGLHKICSTVLICRDKAPRPRINCGWNNRGQREEIYDPKLDALVTWRCDCPWGKYGNCHWVRVSLRPVPADYLIPPNSHHVWDWMRKCASLVCVGFKVDHWYRSLRSNPNRLSDD